MAQDKLKEEQGARVTPHLSNTPARLIIRVFFRNTNY
jgi:hypothetical protein